MGYEKGKQERSEEGEKVDQIKVVISEFTEYGSILRKSLHRIPKNSLSE
jgi:hypothetical protein